MRGAIGLGVSLWASTAAAQELGLDLTDSTDYRPNLGIVGVAVVDASLPADLGEKLKVDRLAEAAVAAAEKLSLYQAVVGPGDAFAKLSDQYVEALACAEVACMREVAARLDVNQVLTGQLVAVEGKPVLRVVSFTRFTDALETIDVAAGGSASSVEKAASAAFQAALEKAAAVLSFIKVKSGTQGATARLGDHPLGPLPIERPVPPGTWKLVVEAEGHLADELDVELRVGEVKEVEANLVPKAPEPTVVVPEPPPVVLEEAPKPRTAPIWARPGLYVAAAGAATLAAGLLLGSSAKSVEGRAKDGDGDGALDITRREANAARTNAALANVLVPVGVAAAAGGTAWLFFAPSVQPRSSEQSAEVAAVVGIGGLWP